MENISVGNSNASSNLTGASAPRSESQQAERAVQRVIEVKETSDSKLEFNNNDEQRFEAVKRASQQMIGNPFPVSDVRFTIYKDKVEGMDEFVFITRFTSLRDGKVTIVPEASAGGNSGTLLNGTI